MQAVTGVFRSESDAQGALAAMRATGVPEDRITLLTPGKNGTGRESVPIVAGEQPGMGKAVGAVLGLSLIHI